MALVDISRKSECYRSSTACAHLPDIALNERICTILRSVAEKAARESWLYVPHLHPVDIDNVLTTVTHAGEDILIQVTCSTIYKTGVEMDALFATCAACAAVSAKYYSFRVKKIHVVRKVKLPERPRDTNNNNAEQIDYKSVEVIVRENIQARCVGYLNLKDETLRLVKEKRVEKGDPVEASRVAALLALKRAWQLIPLFPRPKIEAARVDVSLEDSHVRAEVLCKMPVGHGSECLFALLVCLVCFWDMVKKYEKDEMGQYPHTYMYDIELEIGCL